MRVCEAHMKRAIDTLVSRLDHTEYDICEECKESIIDLLGGSSTSIAKDKGIESRRKRTRRTVKRNQVETS